MKYTSPKIDFCVPDNPCRANKNTNNFFIGNFTILTQLCYFFVVFWPFLFVLFCYNFFFTMTNCALNFVEFLCVVRSKVTSLNLSFKSVMAAEQAVRKEFRLKWVEMSTCNQYQLHKIVYKGRLLCLKTILMFFNDENDSLCILFHLVPFGGLPVNWHVVVVWRSTSSTCVYDVHMLIFRDSLLSPLVYQY